MYRKKELFNWELFKKVAKMPTTWLNVLIIFCSYATLVTYFYITPYATAVFGTSAIIAAGLGYFSQYCRPIGSFLSGILADKLGSSKMLLIAYSFLIVGLLGLIFTPGTPSVIWILLVFIAVIYTSMYAVQSMHFAIMEEGDYPVEITGTANSIISTVGYSAEFFMPVIAGMCLDSWSGALGYKVYFGVLTGLAVIGLISTLIWLRVTKEKRAFLKAEREKKAYQKNIPVQQSSSSGVA